MYKYMKYGNGKKYHTTQCATIYHYKNPHKS